MLSEKQAQKINDDSPLNQLVSLGNVIRNAEQDIESIQEDMGSESDQITPILGVDLTVADASAGISVLTDAPFSFRIVDVVAEARAASASGTVKLTDGDDNDITDAITFAVDKAIDRAATIDDAYSTIAAGGSVKAVTHGADDAGLVTMFIKKV